MVAPSVYEVEDRVAPSAWRVVRSAMSTLQFKATALVVVLTLSVTGAVSGYLLQSSGQLARAQIEERAINAAELLAEAAAVMIASGNLDDLQPLAIEHANGAPLLYVIISDVDGRQLAVAEHHNVDLLQRLERNELERVPVPGEPILHPKSGNQPIFFDVTYPISSRDTSDEMSVPHARTLRGYVRTGMVGDVWTRTMSSKLDLVVGVGTLALLVAVPLGFLVIRRIVAPLDGLTDAMLEFSQGKLDVRSPVVRRDEIGVLASAFNQMADQHQQTHERIIRLNAELEERVAHRTHQLRELASRDPLTGLYNRRYFNETLQRCFAEAIRYDGDLSCIMIDLDEFKAANDKYGHHVGDELLVLTARTLNGRLRSADVAARFGGDEFIILLPQTDSAQAATLGEQIVIQFARDVSERFPGIRVSMSIGIASLRTTKVEHAETLVRSADQALYEAKAAGKNKLVTASAAINAD
ncbi:MAG: diguanylate cyclase [Planctomycetes bacterium]|nr:diguanylate cyclase [Planctomycetota bacterium]